jgi:putative oxidoreductase
MLRILAPLMLAWVFVRGPLGPENRLQLVRLNASVQIAAAALLAIGKLPRLAALTLAASLVPPRSPATPSGAWPSPARARSRRSISTRTWR